MAGMLPEQGGNLKEPPPLPCPTRSFEHVLLHVGLARWLLAFGRNADMPATVCGSSRFRFNYGSRTVANHAQGREIVCPKNVCLLLYLSSRRGNFSSNIFENILRRAVDKPEKRVCAPKVPFEKKTPPLPCATVPVNFCIMRDGADGFRRPVKVAATVTADVPDCVIPIQGPSCESRAGQGKSVSKLQRPAGDEP